MKLFKKYILLMALFSAIISLFVLINTYAKYATSAKQIADIPIARWNIKVNDVSIKLYISSSLYLHAPLKHS